jgi:hypothetical protein
MTGAAGTVSALPSLTPERVRALVIREHMGLGATLKPAMYAGFIFKSLIPPRQLP